MNLGQRIRKGVKWLLVGNVGGQFMQFAFGVVLARLLVPADFGMIVTIQVFTGFVAMLASGGMGQSLIRSKEANTDDFNAVFTMQLGIGVVMYLGLFVSAPWFAEHFDNPVYSDLLRVSAISFILRPFALIRVSWLAREMNFKKRSLIDLVVGALTGASSVLMAAAGMGVWSLTLSGLVGAFIGIILLSYVTPLRLRLHFRIETMRRHSAYGIKITVNDFLSYLKENSINLILSKMAGPSFLGLFNKAESLGRMPNRLLTPPTGQTVFRAMSMIQDDLDQTKYMFYRTITLLMVYISPFLVGLWWVAEPFIGVIYGEKWLPSAEPLKVMVVAGILRTIGTPCGVLLAAQNRLTQEMVGQVLSLIFAVSASIIGLKWGLEGVAWAMLASGAFSTAYMYLLVYRTIPTGVVDLLRAVAPALLLNTLLCGILALVHFVLADLKTAMPPIYLAAMVFAGGLAYGLAFLFLPIPALRTEADRWRQKLHEVLSLVFRTFT